MGGDYGGGGCGACVAEIVTQFDWKNPDYSAVFAERARRLAWLRADDTGQRLRDVSAYYATDEGAIDFVADWGVTFDPRLAEVGLPTIVPFILSPSNASSWLGFWNAGASASPAPPTSRAIGALRGLRFP